MNTQHNHDVGSVMAYLHPWKLLLHLTGCLSINLVLAVVLLFEGEDFPICEDYFFLLVFGVPLEETFCSCLSDLIQIVGKGMNLLPPVGSHA